MKRREKPESGLDFAELVPLRSQHEGPGIQFPESLIVLVKRRFLILWLVGLATGLALLYCLLWPNSYLADTKIMPPQKNEGMAASMLNQLGPLASLAGQNLGLRTPSDLYIAMLRSRAIADSLIDRFSLMSVYNSKRRVDARNRLEDRTSISAGRDGVISISVEDRNPQRAADLANAYVDELEKLSRSLAVSEASQRRVFFEREVTTASEDLANAEMALKETQQKTGLVMLDSQSRAIIGNLTQLQARVSAQEVLVRSMRSYAAEGNPELVRAEQELAAFKSELLRLEDGKGKRSFADMPIENIPAAGLEYVRKLREVKYREALFELLAKQYEAAKIDEARNALLVQQLDKAIRPEKRFWPKPVLILVLTVIGAGLGAILIAFLTENLERAQRDPEFIARVQLCKAYLRHGIKS